MKIHHLNCGTMCPYGGRLVNRPSAKLVCHCLLIETSNELILVDSGFGTRDILNPSRIGFLKHILRKELDIEDTAVRQVKNLGFSPSDVRHIVLTHLDHDHAGGISDFPHAKIHTFRPEFDLSRNVNGYFEKQRYGGLTFETEPKWEIHEANYGEKWFGFDCVRELDGLPPEVLLVPLAGHSDGHCGIAVNSNNGWIINVGDAYFDNRQMDLTNPKCSVGLRIFQSLLNTDEAMAKKNIERLRDLKRTSSKLVKIHCSHDPDEFEELSGKLLLD